MRQACKVLMITLSFTSIAMAQQPARVLTLSEAVSLALERNPNLAAIEQRVVAARAALRQAEAPLYPRIRVSEAYTGSDNPVQAFMMRLNQRALNFGPATDFNDPSTTDNFNTRLLATYALYNGGRTVAARDAARRHSLAAAHELAAARNDLVFEVTRSFHSIGTARHFLRAAEAAASGMESTVRAATARFAEGSVLKTDVLDAEVRLAQTQEDLLRARNALALSEVVFRNVLGVGEGEDITAAETETSGARRAPLVTPASAGADCGAAGAAMQNADEAERNPPDVSKRPEVLAARETVAAAERQLHVARGGRLPRVNAFASYDVDSGDLDRFSDSFVAGVNVELDLFDGFLTRGEVAAAWANLQAAREQLRRIELAVHMEVKQAQLRLAEARARVSTTTRAVEQAAESEQITRERYANGLALLTQLLDAETALTTARQRRAAAAADLLIADAALDKALGYGGKE